MGFTSGWICVFSQLIYDGGLRNNKNNKFKNELLRNYAAAYAAVLIICWGRYINYLR